MAERKTPDERAAQLLAAAVEIAKKDGLRAVTRASVARVCGVTPGLINRYFSGRHGLRWAVLETAGKSKDASTLAGGVALGYTRDQLAPLTTRETMREALRLYAAT